MSNQAFEQDVVKRQFENFYSGVMKITSRIMIFPSNNEKRYDYCKIEKADMYHRTDDSGDYVDGENMYMEGSLLTSDHPELSAIKVPTQATILILTDREIGWYAVEWKDTDMGMGQYSCMHWDGNDFCQVENRSRAMQRFTDDAFKEIIEVQLHFTKQK